jgi:hypothetical protein
VGCILAELLELLVDATDRNGYAIDTAQVPYGQRVPKNPRVIFSHSYEADRAQDYQWQLHVAAIFKVLAPLSLEQLHRMNENGGEKNLLCVANHQPAEVITVIQELIREAQRSGAPPSFQQLFKHAPLPATNLLQRMLQFLAGALNPPPPPPPPAPFDDVCAFLWRLPRHKSSLHHPAVLLCPHLFSPPAEDRISMHGAHDDEFHDANRGDALRSNQVSNEEVGNCKHSGLLPAFGFEMALGFELGQ